MNCRRFIKLVGSSLAVLVTIPVVGVVIKDAVVRLSGLSPKIGCTLKELGEGCYD